ncbi:GNAT family N-acetyltransferase [Chelativorans sp.]|uniref:GNAT family N-acetyltransferase n=1 Tax=Chelativorans sp. TaxID=2203393 RepID=UPI00281139F7|nr:GNAT family N-acetyltransferase [Chelativorans sp.]
MLIRTATQDDDEYLVRHHLALWESYGIGPEKLKPEAAQTIREFIREGRAHFSLAAFLAIEEGAALGSAACQIHRLPYPEVTLPSFRKFGYIWHVYVTPEARRRGIARALVKHALEHLKAIGCTQAVLHSSDAGERLYESLGFRISKEMRLDL